MGSIYKLLLVFSMLIVVSHCSRDDLSTTTKLQNVGTALDQSTVRIYNELGNGSGLTLHCNSNKDDLGVRDIGVKGSFEWKVRTQTTHLFSCNLTSNDNNMTMTFTSYDARRDSCRCEECVWRVRDDGVHAYSSDDLVDDDRISFMWNNTADQRQLLELSSISSKRLRIPHFRWLGFGRPHSPRAGSGSPGTPSGGSPVAPGGSSSGTPVGGSPVAAGESSPGSPAGGNPVAPGGSSPGMPAGGNPVAPGGSSAGTPAGSSPVAPGGSSPVSGSDEPSNPQKSNWRDVEFIPPFVGWVPGMNCY